MTSLGSSRVLVTGASTGIGRATVDRLVAEGAFVWAGVRREEDADTLEAAHPGRVKALRFDVADDAAVAAAGETVVAAGSLNGLVNNAGVALPAPLEYMPLGDFRRQLEINIVGQLAVTQAMLPALRAAVHESDSERSPTETAIANPKRESDSIRRPRIVMMGSIGGRIAGPIIGAYHTSKFGLAGMTGTLRAELGPTGIDVILVEPGVIATPIWERGRIAGDDLAGRLPPEASQRYGRQFQVARAQADHNTRSGLPPEAVAEVVIEALTSERTRARYLVGGDARMAALLTYLPERVRDWLLARAARQPG